ncbi:MAG: ABC transporter permease [Verrucomicrobia bacterium]|nr:ABC transporter permease [Verrucomicrobiota bacterium]
MRQFATIAANAFMELVRQPVFLLLMTCSSAFGVFLACVPYFGFGDDPKLVKDSVLAVMLLSGLFGAVLSASASLSREIRTGTALAVLAKPVGRTRFLLAKYVGVIGTLTLLTFVNLVSALLASRMAFDAYGGTDRLALLIFSLALILAYALGGLTNYFLRRPFVADAVSFVVVFVSFAFILINFLDKEGKWQTFAKGVDWRLIQASILILFALWILAALALACSTRWDMIPTLAICSAIFLMGLMSDYLFGRRAEPAWVTFNLKQEVKNSWWSERQLDLLRKTVEKHDANTNGKLDPDERKKLSPDEVRELKSAGLGGRAWASVLYTVVPNWQFFWLADALEDKKTIPWRYVGQAFGYVVAYLGASLALALALFEDRELS